MGRVAIHRFFIAKKALLANLTQVGRLGPKPKLSSIFVAPEKATERIGPRAITLVCYRVKEKELVENALNSISTIEQYTKESRPMDLLIREIEEKYYTKAQA